MALDEIAHFGNFTCERLLIEQAIDHIAVERIERTKAESGVGSAQVLLHFPEHAHTGNHEGAVDVVREGDGAIAVFAFQLTQPAEREQPLCEIVEILPIAIGGLADPDATCSAEHSVYFRYEPLGLVQITSIPELPVQRDEQHQAKCIGPQVAQPVRPDPLLAHPAQLVEDHFDICRQLARLDPEIHLSLPFPAFGIGLSERSSVPATTMRGLCQRTTATGMSVFQCKSLGTRAAPTCSLRPRRRAFAK